MKYIATLIAIAIFITAGTTALPAPVQDKTLVAWVCPSNLTQQGGSLLTLIDKAEHFDAIVLGEVVRGKWMAGSDGFRRTPQDQANWPVESAASNTLVQLAIAYRGDRVTLFRNGKEYVTYPISQAQSFGDDAMVLLGLRYVGGMGEIGFFTGAIEDARIYDTALNAQQIGALAPNESSDPKPLAWWTFEDGKADDLMKRFPASRLEGNARVADGKLVLDGSSYLWAAKDAKLLTTEVVEETSFDTSVQTLFYKARSKRTGNMWDTWLYFDQGDYYLYYLANARSGWDNISMARSRDGVHWNEIGRVLSMGRGVTWMGTGSTWMSPRFEKDSKFFMNFSECKGPRQTIFFAESKDLVHWTRLGNEYEFVQDERWYEKNGRWDCIWTLPRPGGGLYGYWTATPKAETGGRFGFGETLDGVTWKALAPPKVPGVGEGEVGAIVKIGEKYYMMFGTGGLMVTLVADRPEGPFLTAQKNSRLLSGHTYFSRFFPIPEGVLVNHHSIARDGQVYFGTLKATVLDAEGTLRLGWWKGNEKMKHQPIDIIPPADGKAAVAMLQNAFDVQQGVILEGTLVLPGAGDSGRRGLFIECGKNSGVAVLLDGRGVAELGPMQADMTGFKPEKHVNREMTFGPSAQFRLLLKHSLMEFYLNDILIECFSLPQKATGHIGLLHAGDPAAVTALKAWRPGEPQLAAKADEQKTPPKDDVYSRAAPGTYNVPPELKHFRLLSSTPIKIGNAEAAGYDPTKWQSDPSRIIYHDGKYHVWMIDGYLCYNQITKRPENGLSWIRHLNSKDGKTWQSVGFVPVGPKGSCYDLAIEQANVVMHEGRFYLFSEALTTNTDKYKQIHAGIVCLVADAPEGPWKQVGDLMLRPENDGRSFDSMAVVNPCHVFFQGKWLMYYKGCKEGRPTDNGLAIADSLTGPYKKYGNNPLLRGHGHFAWRYKHGIIMMMFDCVEKNDTRILWTEDGMHFVPLVESEGTFLYGSLYCPGDPLFGKPVTGEPVTKYWGLQTLVHGGTTGLDVERIEWQFGSDSVPSRVR